MTKIFTETLVYLVNSDKILLIEKKRGLGKGLYNGVGGKVEEKDKSIEDAAIREVKEEVGVTVKELEERALLLFIDTKLNEVHYVHVYISNEWDGNPIETEEAKPVWFSINEIPYDKMWEDDIYWLPYVLNGKKIYGKFIFENWKLKHWEVYESNILNKDG